MIPSRHTSSSHIKLKKNAVFIDAPLALRASH